MNTVRCTMRIHAVIVLVLLVLPASKAGPEEQHLGKVRFPTSCAAEASPAINTGVALLHSFEYQHARQIFSEVLEREPKCAAAHWGKAMSGYMQIWEFPDGKTLKAGRREIAKARKGSPKDSAERGFLEAAAAFYQSGRKTHRERMIAYSKVLDSLYRNNPHDPEAGSFYALSLLALAYDASGDRETRAYMEKAIEVLRPLLEEYPDHPGVAHYMVHATDRPEFAPQGLAAARRYAAIAPDSSHALHMPSHIFVRVGLWQDSINCNLAARQAGAHAAEMHQAEAHYQTHAIDFLSYSYLQSGEETKARELISAANDIVGADQNGKARTQAYLRARTALELHNWKEAAALTSPEPSTVLLWARTIGAARTGNLESAEQSLKQMTERVAEREKDARKNGYPSSGEKAVDLSEAEAWVLSAQGKHEEALKELRAAADREDHAGGESVGVPAREMLGDLLMELQRPAEALAEYQINLKNAPRRFDGLVGAARAAKAAGDARLAEAFYRELQQACSPSANRPELAEAQTFLAHN
jgi:tetratricopeptide (TPR) repeat protein